MSDFRKPPRGASYILISDGRLRSLLTGNPRFESLVRQTATYARMTLDGIAARTWDSTRQPPARSRYLLLGTSEGEEIWKGITREQAWRLRDWIRRQADAA